MLVIVGSLISYSAYTYANKTLPIEIVSTYAYVNPVVAVFLGALILDEPITAAIITGGAIVVIGVALVGIAAAKPIQRGMVGIERSSSMKR